MLRHAADLLERRTVRGFVIAVGVVATVFLFPTTVFVAVIGFWAILDWSALSDDTYLQYAYIGPGGLAGIVAAWTRVIVNGSKLKEKRLLRVAIIGGLFLGTSVAAYLAIPLVGDPLFPAFWVYVLSACAGFFLLASTIGITEDSG
jgi:hypothetical protein